MKEMVRKLPALAVFCLTLLVCCWWVIAATILAVVKQWRGIAPTNADFTDSGVLCLVILELAGLAVLFRVGRIRGWSFESWGFQPSWLGTGAGVLLCLGMMSPKYVAIEFVGFGLAAGLGWLRGWSFATWKLPSSPASTAADVLLCFALYLLVWGGNQIFLAIHPGKTAAHSPIISHVSLPFLILLVVVNPVFEETIQTGFFIQCLQRYGILLALLPGALFPGLGHTYAGLGAVVGNIGFGLIVGFIYWKWRRLWPLFIVHALLDLSLHFQTRAPG
jgi:membrane protease YdiL (CAAX protease family)